MSHREAELLRGVVPWANLETYHGPLMSSSVTEGQGAAIGGGPTHQQHQEYVCIPKLR